MNRVVEPGWFRYYGGNEFSEVSEGELEVVAK
jgi:hypothetical protein